MQHGEGNTEVSGIIVFVIKGTLGELECKIYRSERGEQAQIQNAVSYVAY